MRNRTMLNRTVRNRTMLHKLLSTAFAGVSRPADDPGFGSVHLCVGGVADGASALRRVETRAESPTHGRDPRPSARTLATRQGLRAALSALTLATLVSCERCGGASSSQTTEVGASSEEAAQAPVPSPGGTESVLAELEVKLDLLKSFGLVERFRQGTWIDFSDDDYLKYTQGGFYDGLGEARALGSLRGRDVSSTARVFVLANTTRPHSLEVQVRKQRATSIIAFVNGKEVGSFPLGEGIQTYTFKVPEKVVVAGENYVLLRFLGTATTPAATLLRMRLGEKDVAAAKATEGAKGEAEAADEMAKGTGAATIEALDALSGPKPHTSESGKPGLRLQADDRVSGFLPASAEGMFAFEAQAEGGEGTVEFRFWQVGAGEGPGAFQPLAVKASEAQEFAFSFEGGPGDWYRYEVRVPASSAPVVLSRLALFQPKAAVEPPDAAAKPKHIVVLLIDTLRAERLKAFNKPSRVKTPALDALAERGVVFEHAISPENWTKPAVASLLTGLWPMTHQTKEDGSKLPDKAELVSEIFQSSGYATASFIANGFVSEKFGFNQGWGKHVNYIRDGKRSEAENVFKDGLAWIDTQRSSPDAPAGPEAFKPFFLYLQTIDPHVPYDPPGKWLEAYDPDPYDGPVKPRLTPTQLADAKRNPPKINLTERDRKRLMALHDGEISYHDEELARFMEGLRERGLAEDTLIVITSDHGEEFAEHASWGHGHSLYNELLHVPLLFHYPRGIKPARIADTVSTLHVAPTVLSMAGVRPFAAAEGVTLEQRLAGGGLAADHQVGFSDFLEYQKAVQTRRWKGMFKGHSLTVFDLKSDAWEKTPLDAAKEPYAGHLLRGLLGRFVGAQDRRTWLEGGVPPDAPQKPSSLSQEKTHIDPETEAQLKALGYGH